MRDGDEHGNNTHATCLLAKGTDALGNCRFQ